MKIVVNGIEMEAFDGASYASYENVVEIAGKTGNPSVTFSLKHPNGERSGSLWAGTHVRIEPGIVFNVVHTDKA